ncbi:MAG: RNA 2'-phosphotransferase [Bacteroidota bacterium]
MNAAINKRISKLMSLALRHKPKALGIELDAIGWCGSDELINGLKRKGIEVDFDLLKEVVNENDKQRFIFNEDGSKIRANQGHSIDIDLELVPAEPPEYLYHGTIKKFMDAIQREGLKKMSRQHVHLSHEKETATNVGSRRGKAIVLTVRSGEMNRDGIEFYQSANGVWLTDKVMPHYILQDD